MSAEVSKYFIFAGSRWSGPVDGISLPEIKYLFVAKNMICFVNDLLRNVFVARKGPSFVYERVDRYAGFGN